MLNKTVTYSKDLIRSLYPRITSIVILSVLRTISFWMPPKLHSAA